MYPKTAELVKLFNLSDQAKRWPHGYLPYVPLAEIASRSNEQKRLNPDEQVEPFYVC